MVDLNALIKEHTDVISKLNVSEIQALANSIVAGYKRGGKVLVCGNGGSGADAQHFVAELVGKFMKERRAYAAICLNTNVSILTAVINDFGPDMLFSRQVQALGNPNDIFIGISTSGNSKNVHAAMVQAKSQKMVTIALVGGSGGTMKGIADIVCLVPSSVTARIQEAHITIIHSVCQAVEEVL